MNNAVYVHKSLKELILTVFLFMTGRDVEFWDWEAKKNFWGEYFLSEKSLNIFSQQGFFPQTSLNLFQISEAREVGLFYFLGKVGQKNWGHASSLIYVIPLTMSISNNNEAIWYSFYSNN